MEEENKEIRNQERSTASPPLPTRRTPDWATHKHIPLLRFQYAPLLLVKLFILHLGARDRLKTGSPGPRITSEALQPGHEEKPSVQSARRRHLNPFHVIQFKMIFNTCRTRVLSHGPVWNGSWEEVYLDSWIVGFT